MADSSEKLKGKGECGVNRRLKINFHIGQVGMGTYRPTGQPQHHGIICAR